MTGAPPAGIEIDRRITVELCDTTGSDVAGSSTFGPFSPNPAMLTNSVALSPRSITAMSPQGSLIVGPLHAVTSLPDASSTARQPGPFVDVVPSRLGALPTITQPDFSTAIAAVSPTPPGQFGIVWGSRANK